MNSFLEKLNFAENTIEFTDTMAVIDENYEFTAQEFKNGDLVNQAGDNSGSCKIFSFAKLNQLTKEQTLACFGKYYRDDVLQNPSNTDHQNIRNFMKTGWQGIEFKALALKDK
jgi:hypothetical protein